MSEPAQPIAASVLLASMVALAVLGRRLRWRRRGRQVGTGLVAYGRRGTCQYLCERCWAFMSGMTPRQALAWARQHAANHHTR